MYCAGSIGQIERWSNETRPDWILYEPPELIGSKDKSVATEKAESIRKAADACGKTPLIVGAGVKTRLDVEVSLEKGAMGVGLASGIVLAKDPKKVLLDLVKGFGNTKPTPASQTLP
jgi:triosephosphate isomerase